MVLEQIRHLDAKEKKKDNLIHYTKPNIKWIMDLNVKHKVI